jgi:hypothetical protein
MTRSRHKLFSLRIYALSDRRNTVCKPNVRGSILKRSITPVIIAPSQQDQLFEVKIQASVRVLMSTHAAVKSSRSSFQREKLLGREKE